LWQPRIFLPWALSINRATASHPESGAPESDSRRLFIAIDLPDDVRKQLADVLRRLQTGCRFVDCHPKWVKAENLHVTLVFLGNVADSDVSRVSDIMISVVRQLAPFELSLEGLSFFPPDVKDPKVFSTVISGQINSLKSVYGELAGALRAANVYVENRPYRPHLTLARLTSVKTASRLGPLAESHCNMLNAKFPVNEIVLFESRLGPNGATYNAVAVAPLRGETDDND